MLSTLILASALATQVNASDGPIRGWHEAHVNGKNVWLWGWENPGGGVGYYRHENAQVFNPPPATPAAAPRPLGAGMVLEANGTINTGLDLKATHPTTGLESNDPTFGARLGLEDDRCPNSPPDNPAAPPAPDFNDVFPWLIAGGLGLYILFRN